MIIRTIETEDLEEIKQIHACFYASEFEPINWAKDFLCAFVVEHENKIVTAGGVRTILEAVAVTNKDFSVQQRRDALFKLLKADVHIAKHSGYDAIHAFIQDPTWEKQLLKKGFRFTKGDSLIFEV